MAIELTGTESAMAALATLGLTDEPNRTETTTQSSSQRPKFATVSIPDIRMHKPTATPFSPQTGGTANSIDTADDSMNAAKTTPISQAQKTLTNLMSIKQAIEKQTQTTPATKPTQARSSQTIGERVRTTSPSTTTDVNKDSISNLSTKPDTDCFLARLDAKNQQIAPIVENIAEKFPVGGNSVIAFARTESNEQLELVIAGTALSLQETQQCRVLIIDSDVESGELSDLMGCKDAVGLTDLNSSGQGWSDGLNTTCNSSIHFLPLGKGVLASAENTSEALRGAFSNSRDGYDYVLVNVGDAHGRTAEQWADYINGTFLLVSMTETNQTVAKSAVAQLNSFGARLIGCVVSDSLS